MYPRTLPLLLLLCLVGCQTEPARLDLSRTVTVDALLAAWKSDTGHIRDWHGREVTVSGRLGACTRPTVERFRVDLLGDSSPDAVVPFFTIDPPGDAPFARVTARGKLVCDGRTLAIERDR